MQDQEIQLISNRVNLIKQESEKAWKKIIEAETRAQ
jgi:hypothetical protein